MRRAAPGRGWYALAVLILVPLVAAVARLLMVIVADPIRTALHMSDAQLGVIQGVGISLILGIAALPLGWLADRFDRRVVLMAALLMLSFACAGCAVSASFTQMMFSVTLIGIAQAAVDPTIYGLIPLLFSEKHRVLANSIYATAAQFVGAAALVVAGVLVSLAAANNAVLPAALRNTETWRLAFLSAALLVLPIALLIGTIDRLRLAPGHASASAPEVHSRPVFSVSMGDYLRGHWRTLLGYFGGWGLLNLGSAGLISWIPVLAFRKFAASPSRIGTGMGTALMIGVALGFLIGKFGAHRYAKSLQRVLPARVIAIGCLCAALLAPTLLIAASATQLYCVVALQLAAVMAGVILYPTGMQDIAPPHLRSRVISIGVFVTILQCLGLVLVGVLSDFLGNSPRGLALAIVAVEMLGFGLSAVVLKVSEASFARTTAIYAPQVGH